NYKNFISKAAVMSPGNKRRRLEESPNPRSTHFMSTDMITTPPIIANGKYQMPPIAEDDRYLAKWHKQELEADFDWLQWNQNVSDEHPEDLVWPTRRIVGLRTRVVDDEVREILTFNWQPCSIQRTQLGATDRGFGR